MKVAYLVFNDRERVKFKSIKLIIRNRFILALIIILLIAPQTQKENMLLTEFHESGFFANYAESKHFLNCLTWVTIFIFLAIHLIK